MVVSKTSDHTKIKIKMPNPSQEPPGSSEAQKQDLKDIDIRVCILKMDLSEVKTSLAVISTTAKLYWAL